jgi:DNA (cytosine-5)-methyltransferase 1
LDKRQNGRRFKENNEEMFTITGQDRHGVLQKAVVRNDDKWRIKSNNKTNCLDANYGKGIDYHGARTGVLEIDKLGNIYPSNGQNGEIYNNKGIAPTLQTKSSSSFRILIDYRIKRLTPLECWRLMGFKDNDYWKARKALEEKYYNGKDRSNSQMYKMSGNSIVVNVLEYIFEELFKDKL